MLPTVNGTAGVTTRSRTLKPETNTGAENRGRSQSPARRGCPLSAIPATSTSAGVTKKKTVKELTEDIERLTAENARLKTEKGSSFNGTLVAVAGAVCLAIGIYAGRNYFAETTEALQAAYAQNMDRVLGECSRNVSLITEQLKNGCQLAVKVVKGTFNCALTPSELNWEQLICNEAASQR